VLHGVLGPLNIPPGTSGFEHRQGVVYLPPAFFATPRPELAVIVMLGGSPGGPEDWTRGGFAARTADAYGTQHQGVAPILAFVDHNGTFTNDTECVDGPAGNAETFLADDVPRVLSDLLRVPLDPPRWAIAGFSEGGTCAFELAVRHPDVYGTFVDLAGDRAPNLGSDADTLQRLYGGDGAAMAAHDPDTLLRPHQFHHLNGWFLAGASDAHHVAVAHSLARAARDAGITVSETMIAGAHNWQFAAAAFRAVLPTVAAHLDAVPTAPTPGTPPGPQNA
jgi:S-formylglutathione hydrolase FrmB